MPVALWHQNLTKIMKKLKLQVQMSVDGFISGPNGEMDWMVWNWDDALKNYVIALTEPVDCILLGRKLAEGFIPHWSAASEIENEEQVFALKMSETHKVVFTKTLESADWSNTVLAKGNLADEINALKNQDGSDIIVYGGGAFVSSLINAGLIDEYHLFINPVILGSGMSIFQSLSAKQNLVLKQAQGFDCGITVLCYEIKKD
jgi:dihydrofolate reductase